MKKKQLIWVSVYLAQKLVLIEDTVICVSSWRRDQHFSDHLNQVKV